MRNKPPKVKNILKIKIKIMIKELSKIKVKIFHKIPNCRKGICRKIVQPEGIFVCSNQLLFTITITITINEEEEEEVKQDENQSDSETAFFRII